jgi:tetratricopeptide (TPR) repeat protein
MSLAQLGGEDLSRSFLSLVETGRSRISLRALAIVANRLDLPISYFLGGSEATADAAAQVLAEEAEIAFGRQRPAECLHLLDEAERTARRPLGSAVRLLRARAYGALRRSNEAVTLLRDGLQDVDKSDDPHGRAEYHYFLGGALYSTGSYDEAHLHLRRALDEVHEAEEDPILTGKIMVAIGHILFVHRDIDRAISHYRSAVDFFGAVRDYHTQGTIYAGLSLAFKRKGDLGKALEYARLGAALFRAGNDVREMAQLMNNMAVALLERGDLTEAEEVALQALARAQQVQAVQTEAAVHGTLASIYVSAGDLERADHEARMASDLAEDDHDPARIASWVWLARIAERQGDLDRADELYRQALQQLKETGRLTRYAEIALVYSELLEKRGDLAGAVTYAREAARTQTLAGPDA